MMDVKSGKTLGVAFIECRLVQGQCLQSVLPELAKLMPVQGRRLRFTVSSYDEISKHLFTEWPGTFIHGLAHTSMNHEIAYFINQKSLQSLLNICRNYKVHPLYSNGNIHTLLIIQ